MMQLTMVAPTVEGTYMVRVHFWPGVRVPKGVLYLSCLLSKRILMVVSGIFVKFRGIAMGIIAYFLPKGKHKMDHKLEFI